MTLIIFAAVIGWFILGWFAARMAILEGDVDGRGYLWMVFLGGVIAWIIHMGPQCVGTRVRRDAHFIPALGVKGPSLTLMKKFFAVSEDKEKSRYYEI